jgi:hypothetical protein
VIVQYADLLGTPWAALDCRAAVRTVYERAGSPLPPGALEAPSTEGWQPVGRPLRPLDVIACGTRGVVSHVAVVVRTSPRAIALTSGEMYGVVAVSVSSIGSVLGVYRRVQ